MKKKALLKKLSQEIKRRKKRPSFNTNIHGDIADLAQAFEEDELAASLHTLDSDRKYVLGRCMDKLKEGTYGVCDYCGKDIPKARLDADPFTISCVDCQQEVETGKKDFYSPELPKILLDSSNANYSEEHDLSILQTIMSTKNDF